MLYLFVTAVVFAVGTVLYKGARSAEQNEKVLESFRRHTEE